MESLSDSLARYREVVDSYPEDAKYLPDDGICPECSLIVRNNPTVEKLLALRGLKYYDDKENRVINKGVPHCRCEIVADEENRANASQYLLSVRSAGLPASVKGRTPREFVPGTFANFVERQGAEDAYETALNFTVGNSTPVIVFVGPSGSGKTHLLEAIGRQFLDQGRTVRYELVAHLLQRLRSSYSMNEESRVIEVCYGADVLLLDDLGLEKPSEWVVEQLTSLIDERWRNNRLLAVGTNESHITIEERLGPRIASRLFDRTTGKSEVVYLVTGDYRAQ